MCRCATTHERAMRVLNWMKVLELKLLFMRARSSSNLEKYASVLAHTRVTNLLSFVCVCVFFYMIFVIVCTNGFKRTKLVCNDWGAMTIASPAGGNMKFAVHQRFEIAGTPKAGFSWFRGIDYGRAWESRRTLRINREFIQVSTDECICYVYYCVLYDVLMQ